MKMLIILLCSCFCCFCLPASQTTDDHEFKKFLNYIDETDIEARLPYLIDMQERSELNNPSVARYFSVQLAVELEVMKKKLERRFTNEMDNIRYMKEAIYNSSSADEIKSYLMMIDECEKNKELSAIYREYIDVLKEKYCHWLKDL